MADYSLMLYGNVLQDPSLRDNITQEAQGWGRTIRFQGGYWDGDFTIRGKPGYLNDFFYSQLGNHIEETFGGLKTWEGLLYSIEHDSYRRNPFLRVQACGYVLTCNWRFVSADDDADGNVSDWIDDIVATDCPYIASRSIAANTLQARRSTGIKQRAWDEILKNTLLGDANNNPWRFFVTNGRRAVYEQVNTGPQYYTRGGLVRRRSFDGMYNSVAGQYIAPGATTTSDLSGTVNSYSVTRYGRREEELLEYEVSATAMAAMRNAYLKEHAWPWARVVGSSPGGAQVYDSTGTGAKALSPWTVKPGVYRDLTYPHGRGETGSIFSDALDFIVDEVSVRVGADGPVLSLRTSEYDESDILEAQIENYG